uniref:Transporter n=1 Tax=Romanomermis culicivorax TaxID=13658 RepID=A0A915IXZ4_ROMCU
MISSEKNQNTTDEILPLNDVVPNDDDFLKQSHEKEAARGQFANKMDYLLSLIGYSVGLANIWRFPYLCYQNGGGAFLFPYMICLVFCGVPLFFMEVSIGQFTSRSSATMWSICPWFKGVGWASVVVSLLCSWYFNVLLSYAIFFIYQSLTFDYLPWHWCGQEWNSKQCLDYNNDTIARQYSQYLGWKRNGSDENFWQGWYSQYANVSWKSPSEEYFNGAVLQLSKGLDEPGGIVWGLVPCLLIGWILTFLCLIKGVESSGKAVYFTATFPYILLTVLLVKGLTLEGAMDGIMFYIKPNFTTLLNPKPWSDAAFQVFFSLGPGWGGLVTMGSYNRFHNNVYSDSMYLPLLMELTSVYAGFVVFSVLGFMAHKMGRPVVEVVTEVKKYQNQCVRLKKSLFLKLSSVQCIYLRSIFEITFFLGPSLFFITYPEIVTKLPLSQVWSVLFFFMVVIVGLDTEFVMIETAITAIYDEMPDRFKVKIERIWILIGICTILFLLGLVFVLRSGAYLLHLVDVYSSFYALMVVCIIELISVGWIYGKIDQD